MPYATPAQFIAKFGLDETVQLLADEQRLLTTQLLLNAMAGVWTGAPSQAEQDAAAAALARLLRQLAVSSNTMDGYLRSAVTLPLAEGDANAGTLEDCCLAMARCGLADDSDNATDRMSKTCDTWRAWLRDVAAGRVHLAGENGQAPPSTARFRSGQASSSFNWPGFGGGR